MHSRVTALEGCSPVSFEAVFDIDNEGRGLATMPAGMVAPRDGILETQLMEVFFRREG